MKKYNLHEIMSNAWATYRKWAAPYKYTHSNVPSCYAFAVALKKAWADVKAAAKKAAKDALTGVVRMHYFQYKNEYASCQTVEGSYDKKTKTIEVMTKVARTYGKRYPSATHGICPRCHTYCYGDCMMAR